MHITRAIAGRTIWIEHGNQYDDFNRFPDFGNRYGLPLGYFITSGVVAAAGRSAERAKASGSTTSSPCTRTRTSRSGCCRTTSTRR